MSQTLCGSNGRALCTSRACPHTCPSVQVCFRRAYTRAKNPPNRSGIPRTNDEDLIGKIRAAESRARMTRM
jgi:hypothetical protein